jgi:O-antigen/teichoic acid export membrane protein
LKRKFITNLGFLIILNVIIKPIYVFGIDRVVQNRVGADAYGNFFSLLSIALIFQIFLDLGIENFIRKEIARRPMLVGQYLSSIVILKTLLTIPYAAICIAITVPMHLDRQETHMLLFLLLNQFLASFILYLRANLGGLQFFKTEGVVSVLDRTLMIIIVGFLLLNPLTSGKFQIIWFIKAQSVSYAIVLAISFIIVLRKSESFQFHFDLVKLMPVIQKLKPYALLVLLMAIYYRVDSVFLRVLLPDGEKQAGIYVHAFRILDFMSNYALLFPILLLPIFSKLLHMKERIDELLQLSVLLLIVPSVAVIVPSVIYRFELFDLLYNEHIAISSDVFAILTISYIGMCISYTFGALLTANGNLFQLNLMASSAVLISLTLNLFLVPRLQVVGSALANAISQLFTIAIHLILAAKIFGLKTNYRLIFKLAGYVVILLLTGYFIHKLPVSWYMGYALIFSVGIITALLSNLISARGIITLIKQKEF